MYSINPEPLDDDTKRIFDLLNLCKEVECFKFDDLLIFGNRVSIVKQYMKENPSKPFRTWLIDTKFGKQVY